MADIPTGRKYIKDHKEDSAKDSRYYYRFLHLILQRTIFSSWHKKMNMRKRATRTSI